MSSCQDSMDTEDSIPQPEYEDIVPSEDNEDDEEEFWVEKPTTKPMVVANGTQTQDTESSAPSVSSESSPYPATDTSSSNTNQLNLVKSVLDDEENEEISYDEADEEYEEDEDDEEVRQSLDNLANHSVIQAQRKDDPTNISGRVKPVVPGSANTTLATPSAGAQNETRNNKVVLLTLINENGKLLLPITSKPAVESDMVKRSPPVTPDEEKLSPMDEIKSSQLLNPKEDQPRSSTPSGRGTREFIALQRSFTESKVLSEFVNEKDRSRKSRKLPLKSDDSTMGDSSEREKFRICRARSKSCTRTSARPVVLLNNSAPQKWPSDEKLNSKRENMRSQNTDFVQKQMKFLNRVNHNQIGDYPLSDASDGEHSLNDSNKTVGSAENKDDCWQPPPKKGADSFCWKCRKCADLIACSKCPRSFHYKCVKLGSTIKLDRTWICPECLTLESCINGPKKAKKEALSMDMLNQLLLFALKRMKQIKGHEKLLDVPDDSECPLYARYVVNPVTLNTIQGKIEKKIFRCTEEFVLETKWIQHNVSIAYAAYSSKYALVAKNLLKVCRQEAAEIETCSECYLNANTRKDWFVDVCLKPHILLWAKLKGFPYWPAKGMGLGPNSLVNVRFFGDHDRAFVPVKDCFLYSETDPNPPSGKRPFRPGIADCIKEVDVHIEKIRAKVGGFNFAPVKTQYDPNNETTQLEEMMPGVTEYVKRQQAVQKPPLTYKIVKTAGNNLSIIRKPDSGTDSDHSSLSGSDKSQRMKRTSTEILKPSPLSETKITSKGSPTSTQSPTPKSTTTGKCILNKTVGLNYEVVAKPANKDESNSSKITSVILKRKSDVYLLSSSVKKSKSSEDVPIKECIRDVSSPKQEAKLEDIQEPTEEVPAKRTRLSRSSEKISTTQGSLPPAFVLIRSTPSEQQKQPQPQKSQQQQRSQQTQESQQQTKTQKPQQQQQQKCRQSQSPSQKSDITANSTINKDAAAASSSAMVKLVQSRQGVTIKKIPKDQSGITTYFISDDNETKNASRERKNSIRERYSQMKLPPITSKAIPLPAPPPKPAESSSKNASSAPKPASAVTACKSSPSHHPARDNSSQKRVSSPSGTEKPKPIKGLIPFEDIKLERTEDDDLVGTKSTPSTSKAIDPLATSNRNSTSNSSQTAGVIRNPKTAYLGVNPPSIPVNPDIVKLESLCDDDSSTNSIPSQGNSSPAIGVNISSNKSSEPPRLVGETMIQRIVVRSLESLTMQPPPLKSVPSYYLTTRSTSSQSATPPVTTSPAPSKTGNPRARKSFPNKGPNPTTAMLPPDVKRSLTNNSMVYIPGDSQSNTVPLQPLTAVSKSVNHSQAMAKVTCTTSIPASSSPQNSSNTATTSTSTAIPLPTPAPPPPPPPLPIPALPIPALPIPALLPVSSVTVSAALTNSTNAVSSVVTAVTSSVTPQPSYIASLKTLSPLQLTVPPIPTTEAEESNESNREGEGHILSGIVTPSLAAAITDTIVRGPPRLAPRPNGALRSDGNYGFNSDAGPVCRTLVEGAHKMTDFFISVMQDTVSDMANSGILPAKIVELQLELETKTATYEKQLFELKQNTDTMLCEMKKSMEAERVRIVSETRRQCEIERIHAVEQTKKRQWCKNCGREGRHYCCWNTAYCDSTCQNVDWQRHKEICQNKKGGDRPGTLYPAPNFHLPSSTYLAGPHNHTINCVTTGFMAHHPMQLLPHQSYQTPQPLHLYQPVQPVQPVPTTPSGSVSITPTSQTPTTATTHGNVGLPSSTSTTGAPTNSEMTFKSKEVLKLPSTTYLRPLQPTMRIAAPPVQRFNIPLPLGATASAGGPPYTLVHREGNWELMSTSIPSSIGATATATTQQQPRILTTSLPPGSRTLAPIVLRPNNM